MSELDDLIASLSANYSDGVPEAVQLRAVARIAATITDDDLPRLIQPLDKGCWDNAAKTLEMIGFPRIGRVEEGLVRWLRDLNWPGAQRIYQLMLDLPESDFVRILQYALITASREDDPGWLYFLRMLIDQRGAAHLFNAECKVIMSNTESAFS